MVILNFIKSKIFWINVGIATGLIGVLLLFSFSLLDNYTLHGETIEVPDLRNLELPEARQKLKDNQLQYVIVDSLFEKKIVPGAIIDQDPVPGEKVKYNRTIYLTVNSARPPQVKMPDLQNISLRQAMAILETYGLKTGKLSYIPDFAKNAVLAQLTNGKEIRPGKLLDKGSVIDLKLGNGLSDEKIFIPDLSGMTRANAIEYLLENSLNSGSEVFDETVKDTSLAKVYKQFPLSSMENQINLGTSIDLFYTQSESKIKLPEKIKE